MRKVSREFKIYFLDISSELILALPDDRIRIMNIYLVSIRLFLIVFIYLTSLSPILSQTAKEPVKQEKETEISYPVVLDKKVLFSISKPLGPYSASERAEIVSKRLKVITSKGDFHPERLKYSEGTISLDLFYDSLIILSITDEDAKYLNRSRDDLSSEIISTIRMGIQEHFELPPMESQKNNSIDLKVFFNEHKTTILHTGIAFLSLLVQIFIIFFLIKFSIKLNHSIYDKKGKSIKSFHFRNHILLSEEAVVTLLENIIRGFRILIAIGLIYAYISLLLYLFPWTQSPEMKELTRGFLLTLITTGIAYGIYKGLKFSISILDKNVANWKGSFIKAVKFKTVEIISEEQIMNILHKSIFVLQGVLNLILFYIVIPIIFSFFDITKNWASILFGYILDPFKTIFMAFISYVPNFFYIAAIIFVNRYLIKLSKLFFWEIEIGNISLNNFHRDWAEPTYKIVRSLIIIFTLIVIFPYLPGAQSEAFKSVSLFLGILFSLGSTSVVANVVSGTILTYMYAFKIGDRVKIGDTEGHVIEKTLLVTRINTTKNVVITIPNSSVMSGHIINYSTSAGKKNKGLILHTTITLGYDVPWRKVHEVLIKAANDTSNILENPDPYVLQKSLDDFYVSYELNAYTDKPEIMNHIYSELHQNIQDRCNEADIEILSPHYSAVRDGSMTTIPANYLKEDYSPPPFVVKIIRSLSGEK